jgi:6-phosphofructokinase 1
MGTLQYCSGSIPSLLKHRVVDSSTSSSSEKRLESGPGFSRVVMAGSDSDNFSKPKIETGSTGYVLEDVPHLSDYIPDLPTYSNPLQDNPAYSVVKQYFVNVDDTVAQKVSFFIKLAFKDYFHILFYVYWVEK